MLTLALIVFAILVLAVLVGAVLRAVSDDYPAPRVPEQLPPNWKPVRSTIVQVLR